MPSIARLRAVALCCLAALVACKTDVTTTNNGNGNGTARPSEAGKARYSFSVPGALDSSHGDGEPPIKLTASDGTGLELVALQAAVAVRGPLAFTELTMSFQNPEDRTLEGHFEVVLPAGAAVSRFAMRLASGWQEAEVVEKQAARVAYEDALHRRQDPALLEKAAGNQFSARVFPIPPRGIKEIKVAWSEELPSQDQPYRLRLTGLASLTTLGILVNTELEVVRVVKEHWKPSDFVLERPGTAEGLRAGSLAVGRFRAAMATAKAAMPGVVVLFDTSASRAPTTAAFAHAVAQLGELVAELKRLHGDALPLRIAAFDQSVVPLFDGTAGGFGKAQQDALLARGALGASDFAGALAWASAHGDDTHRRLVLITDGVATASTLVVPPAATPAATGDATAAPVDDGARALQFAATQLKPHYTRLDAILGGGIREEDAMRKLVTGTLAEDGAVLDGDDGAAAVARRLDEATRSGVTVAVDGAIWVWPRRLDGLQAGDDVVVYAVFPDDAPARGTMAVTLSGSVDYRAEVPLADESQRMKPLVERAWARAKIASLAADEAAGTEPDKVAALHKQIVDLSTRYRVLSDATALLVLETDADYARFHIDRHALTDVLTIDDSGLRLARRADAVIEPSQPPPPAKSGFLHLHALAPSLASSGVGAALQQAQAAVDEAGEKEEAKAMAGPRGDVSGVVAGAEAPGGDNLIRELPIAGDGVGSAGSGSGADLDGRSGFAHARRAAHHPSAAPMPSPAAMPPPAAPVVPPVMAQTAAPRGARHAASTAQPLLQLLDSDEPPGSTARRQLGFSNVMAAPEDSGAPPWTGKMLDVMNLVAKQQNDAAVREALAWHAADPGDVLALVALGNAWRAANKLDDAARAYGSIIDLFPRRADLRRFAGDLLESLGPAAAPLAADSFAHAVADRPDHPNSHRLRAYALLRAGRLADAFAAIETGAARTYPPGRFLGVDQILREDAGLIAAAWLAKEPARRAEVTARLAKIGAALPTSPSLRFVLSWETDANDVDFHIRDKDDNRAWFAHKHLDSGGDLYADVTTGYGPECFAIFYADKSKPTGFPYRIQAHYYARGPMGYGMGKVEVVQFDGKGTLRFDERPFVVMTDQAFVDLGVVAKPL